MWQRRLFGYGQLRWLSGHFQGWNGDQPLRIGFAFALSGAESPTEPFLGLSRKLWTRRSVEIAESVPDGPSVRRLAEFAKRFGLFLSAGMSEKENDIVFNTQVLVGPNGYIGRQRKLHTSRDESFFYKGGRDIEVFDIGKCKVATVICYDNQFPEIARIAALKGADVILMPHAAREGRWDDTPESEAAARRHVFDFFSGYRMRARENACFCVYADQAGVAGYVDSLPASRLRF